MSSPSTVGDVREPFADTPLKVTDFVRYQGASGDMNPIHHDSAFADVELRCTRQTGGVHLLGWATFAVPG